MAVMQATVRFPISTPPEPTPQLYELLPRPGEDGLPDPRYTLTQNPNLASVPDVLKIGESGGVVFNEEWQSYLVSINPNLSLHHAAMIMHDGRWGFNRTGIPSHANYIEGDTDGKKDPYTDKDRTFAYNIHAGIESGNEVILTTFDGTKPPPPLSVISPQTHPEMYCILTVVYQDGHVGPFPNEAPITGYPKTGTIFPFVAVGEIRYPLNKVRSVSAWRMPY